MKKILGLVFILATPFFAQANDVKNSIEQMVHKFDLAILEKDEVSLRNLILHDSIPWIGIVSDKSLENVYAKYPNAKIKKLMKLSPEQFIDSIVNNPNPTKEEFTNLKINVDHGIASVHFDYQFFENNKLKNFGQESWQLVNTESGWKINSVIYSVDLNL